MCPLNKEVGKPLPNKDGKGHCLPAGPPLHGEEVLEVAVPRRSRGSAPRLAGAASALRTCRKPCRGTHLWVPAAGVWGDTACGGAWRTGVLRQGQPLLPSSPRARVCSEGPSQPSLSPVHPSIWDARPPSSESIFSEIAPETEGPARC